MKTFRLIGLYLVWAIAGAGLNQGCTPYTPDPSNLTDPVCGAHLERSRAIIRHYDKWEYYFDSEDCARKFDRHPAKYVDMVHCVLENQDG